MTCQETGTSSSCVDRATISMANPETSLHGYPVQGLCRRHNFEEVAYLLWHGKLPTP